MPKFDYNPRTGMMEPKKKSGLEFYAVGGGLKVVDNDTNSSFIILRKTDEIGYIQGQLAYNRNGIKSFDYKKSMQIADRVKRMMPGSQYCNYRKFCYGVSESAMEPEDLKLLGLLVDAYGSTALHESVSSINAPSINLNEGHFFDVVNPEYSDGQTVGTQEHGLKGALKVAPMAVLTFLVCPPLAIIQLLGAVRQRTEKRWLKSHFNQKSWLDFLATPNEQKEQFKKKMKEKMALKTKYYYSTLADGEILKVPAVSALEARDLIVLLEENEIAKRYAEWDRDYNILSGDNGSQVKSEFNSENENIRMYIIRFDDGQVMYAFAPKGMEKEVAKKAEETKKNMIQACAAFIKKQHPGANIGIGKTNGDSDDPNNGLEELFIVPRVEDVEEVSSNIGMYSIITNDNIKDYDDPTTNCPSWKEPGESRITCTMDDGDNTGEESSNLIQFNIPTSDSNTASLITGSVINSITNGVMSVANRQNATNNFIVNYNKTHQGEARCPYSVVTYQIYDSYINLTVIDDTVKKDKDGKQVASNIDFGNQKQNLTLRSNVAEDIKVLQNAFANAYTNAAKNNATLKNIIKGVKNNVSPSKTLLTFNPEEDNTNMQPHLPDWSSGLTKIRQNKALQGALVNPNTQQELQKVEVPVSISRMAE